MSFQEFYKYTDEEKRQFKKMETELQDFIKTNITLDKKDCKENNETIKSFLNDLTSYMKEDEVFKALYTEVFFGGSYYDGLKVGIPEEYDLDLLMMLPRLSKPRIISGTLPGFLKVQLLGLDELYNQHKYKEHRALKDMTDDENYIVTDKVYSWIQGIVDQSLNKIAKAGKYKVCKRKKSGPAITVTLAQEIKNYNIDIDLVPSFVFEKVDLPYQLKDAQQKLFQTHNKFFIVPKTPKDQKCSAKESVRNWRMSFQRQEQSLIKGHNTLKASLRLLKKLRDTQNHKQMASYFLKTIYLLEINNIPKDFWANSLGLVFFTMLRVYQAYLNKGFIPYFWNTNMNLLGTVGSIQNLQLSIAKIVQGIQSNMSDTKIIVKYLSEDANSVILSSTRTTPEKDLFTTKKNNLTPSSSTVSFNGSIDSELGCCFNRLVIADENSANDSKKLDLVIKLLIEQKEEILMLREEVEKLRKEIKQLKA